MLLADLFKFRFHSFADGDGGGQGNGDGDGGGQGNGDGNGDGGGQGNGDGGGQGNGDGGGQGNKTWQSKLPEDIRTSVTLEKFKDQTEMIEMPINVVRSYITAEQLIGRDKIPVPKTEEEWTATYKRLGMPDSAESYILPIDEKLDPKIQEQFGKDAIWFREKAHKLGLNDKQATSLFKDFSEKIAGDIAAIQTSGEDAKLNTEIALRTEFGASYDGKRVLADRAIEELGGEELNKVITASGLGVHPLFIKAMMKVGGMMAEDLGLDKQTGALLQSTESVQEQIATIQASPEYVDATNPAHKIAVAKVAKLMQHLHGNKTVGTTTR